MIATRPDLLDLARLQAQFATSITEVDPTTPVPWCGRWRVRDLVVHLSRVHHWAAGQARRRQETPLGRGPFDLPELYRATSTELLETLSSLSPQDPAWALIDDGVTPDQRRGTVAFWDRRQKLETLIHLWDLRTAAGLEFQARDELWFDAVAEVAAVMQPRQVRLARVAQAPARLVLRTPTGPACELEAAAPQAPLATITAPARDLALLVWGRANLRDNVFELAGDRIAAEATLAAGLTP